MSTTSESPPTGGVVIAFPTRPEAMPWPAKIRQHRTGPTKRRGLPPTSRQGRTWMDVYKGDSYAGMVSIDHAGRVLAWSPDWSTILDQPDVETAVEAIRSGAVRTEARR